MKIINVGGFGNTGCTVQADYLCDFAGIKGVLSNHNRNKEVVNAPYQEFGILKCQYSFGGVLITKLHQPNKCISKQNLRDSLKGIHPEIEIPMNLGAISHLKMRKQLLEEYGVGYHQVVDTSIDSLPEDMMHLSLEDIIRHLRVAVKLWCEGIIELSTKIIENSMNSNYDILGLKNDPPGAYPLLASLIPDGITSAILRDPRDTAFDFNRHYKIKNSPESIEWHCNHYNSQINSARSQIQKFDDYIQDSYFVHDFENFVSSFSHRKQYLVKMCGIRKRVNNYFDESISLQNVGLYRSFPKELVKIIESNCMKNYENFRGFLKERGMLLE